MFQRTIKRPVSCTGIGLHSGKKVNLNIRPADPDTGVMFKRTDIPGAPLIPGDVFHVVDTSMCTTVGKDGVTASTVEHLLSALFGLGVDNVIVELDSPEVPIMDGSAAPFVFLIRHTGLTSQDRPRQFYVAKREMGLIEDDKSLIVEPGEGLSVTYSIEFDHPLIRRQDFTFDLSERNYDKDVSRARTFGFLSELKWLHEHNLALGGSLDNAVVVDEFRVLNDDGLRFPDEFVRHKVLDFIGDMALIGRPVLGHFKAHKAGHGLNNRMFRAFLDDPTAWQLVTPSPEQVEQARHPRAIPVFNEAAAAAGA
jgi:UDP-3-O-[3-hydroxymyristoyl] N-acetylglucosamine deacetylase